jgi:hypothetical protein
MTTLTTAVSPALVFDAQTHRYSLHGRTLCGVTAAIKSAGLIEDRWFSEQATVRGAYVHQALEYLDAGVLDDTTIDPQIAGYVEAYRRFLRDTSLGPVLLNEARLCDAVLGFAGTVDRVRSIHDRHAVIDIKSGTPAPWHGVQLAAYADLVKVAFSWPTLNRYGLYLRPDGTYALKPYLDRSDWDVFRACLTIWQFQQRTNR